MTDPHPHEATLEKALQGNLCRCTGYAPIIRAGLAMGSYGTTDPLMDERVQVAQRLRLWADGARVVVERDGSRAVLPASVDDFAQVLTDHPDARIVAGATDVGLWVTKFLRDLPLAVFIGHLDGLRTITETPDTLTLGALVSYSQADAPLRAVWPELGPYWDRIAGWQVRAMGTIGGNIANGSPIGDTPPVFIALGAKLVLRQGAVRREIALEDYFIAYGKQDRRAGEFVEALILPKPRAGDLHGAYKVSKRRDEDISSVAAGFCVTVNDGIIAAARLAYGGMAATPKRASHAEAALLGQPFAANSFAQAAAAIPHDFTPLSDMRASADYRMKVAQNLLTRFWLEHSGQPANLEDVA
jgi:xanthine dehydrogenase small subunit